MTTPRIWTQTRQEFLRSVVGLIGLAVTGLTIKGARAAPGPLSPLVLLPPRASLSPVEAGYASLDKRRRGTRLQTQSFFLDEEDWEALPDKVFSHVSGHLFGADWVANGRLNGIQHLKGAPGHLWGRIDLPLPNGGLPGAMVHITSQGVSGKNRYTKQWVNERYLIAQTMYRVEDDE